LDDYTDSNTYYCQAIIRDAKDFSIIDTVNLDDKGNRFFHKLWQSVPDVSGEGRWITITTTIYEDAGYTIKSSNYGEKMETYLIAERYNSVFGGGGGADIDYKKVRKIVKEEIARIPQPEKSKEIDLSPLLGEILSFKEMLADVEVSPQVNINLSSVFDRIDKLETKVKKCIETNKIEPTDLSPLLNETEKIESELSSLLGKIEATIKEKSGDIIASFENIRGDFRKIPVISVEKTGIQEEPKKELNTHRKFY
jgi:hypothetical protein